MFFNKLLNDLNAKSIKKYSGRQFGITISNLGWANVGGSQIVWMILKRQSSPSGGY